MSYHPSTHYHSKKTSTFSKHSGQTSHKTRNTASTARKLHFDRAILNWSICFSDFLAIIQHQGKELGRDTELEIYHLQLENNPTKQVCISHALFERHHELVTLLIHDGGFLLFMAHSCTHQVVSHAVPVDQTHVINVLCRRSI